MHMITLEQAVALATEVHEGQWRNPSTVKSYTWNKYKPQTEFIDTNGNKVVWCNGDTFLVYEPYITHPLAVMEMMDTVEEKIVAVLHDVFEDTNAKIDNTHNRIIFKDINYSIGVSLRCAINSLTHYKDETYSAYIKAVSENKLATKVKIADIVHNLSCSPSDHAKEKYLKAIPVLLKSL